MCTGLARCFLAVINVLVTLEAVALIALGGILAFAPSIFFEYVYKDVVENVPEYRDYNIPDFASDMSDFPVVYDAGIALFSFGIFLLVVSVMGWVGACCTSCCRCMLVMFSIIMVLMMISEIVVGSMFYVPDSPLHSAIKTQLKDKIKSDYSRNGKDTFSEILNLIELNFDCCGVDGSDDFGTQKSKACERGSKLPGCYSKLTGLIKDNIKWEGIALAGILVIELIEIIFAVIAYKAENKEFIY